MKVFAPEMQVFMEYLQDRKLKLTPHRQLILDIFLANEGHRSVEDIYRVVREKDPRIGYTTVYRTMKILSDCGLAREIDLADGIMRYEHLYNHEHHDHMICMQCGKSIEFYKSEIEELQDEASAQLGFKVLDHKLQIYGVCMDCRKD
ncbi:MAG TPA: Fur family transcriptional regulator [Terriglobia bacterium]|nr:Fur family transcriptional regulator [Terriglobia bacterium]